MADVFVSYADEDQEWVQKLVHQLRANGVSVWWAPDIHIGEDWTITLEREMAAANCIVVVWSNYSVQSPSVREEAKRGQKRGILAPVYKTRVDNIPMGFGTIQTADLTDWRGDGVHQAFEKFIVSIKRILSRATPQSPAPAAAEPKPVAPTIATPPQVQKAVVRDNVEDEDLEEEYVEDEPNGRPPAVAWSTWVVVGLVAIAGLLLAYHYLRPSPSGLQAAVITEPGPNTTTATQTQQASRTSDSEPPAPKGASVANDADLAAKDASGARERAEKAAEDANASAANAGAATGIDFSGRDPDGQSFHYVGEGHTGVPQGAGVKTWTPRARDACAAGTSSRQEGHWSAGQIDGLSVRTRCDGGSYAGEYQRSLPNGFGVAHSRDGKTYYGQFAAGQPVLGERVWPADGAIRTEAGHWGQKGLDGPAVVTCADGTIWKGQWTDGKLVGPGETFRDKVRVGSGTYGGDQPDAAVCGVASKP